MDNLFICNQDGDKSEAEQIEDAKKVLQENPLDW